MNFYDKEKEVLKRKGNDELQAQAKGILRFEANIRGKELKRYNDHKWVGEMLNEKTATNYLNRYLTKLEFDKPFIVSNQLDIARTLQKEYGDRDAQSLLGFMLFRQLFGEKSINKPSRNTYIKYGTVI